MRSFLRSGLPLVFALLTGPLAAQSHLKPLRTHDPDLPDWARLMYAPGADMRAVVAAYDDWYAAHPFEKTVHTQYFKRWVSAGQARLAADGRVEHLSPAERAERTDRIRAGRGGAKGGGAGWTFVGPDIHFKADGSLTPLSEQANVYCHDRSLTDPDILFCGTESGGLYKTVDQGVNWVHVTPDLLVGAVSAVRIHPTDPDRVLMSAADDLWRSTDGGATWAVIGQPAFTALNISAWEIAFDPSDPQTVLAACNLGLYRSTDGGDTWNEVLPNECMTILHKPFDPSTWYTLHFEPALNLVRFQRSNDHGATWTLFDQGWFTPPPGEEGLYAIEGGKLAVSEDDPQRIYALLVGYQEPGASIVTNGFVGLWRSDDGGSTWTHPHGLVGAPYTAQHPNLMNFTGDDGDYTQIHYNTTLVASHLDADRVLIGGLSLWQSDDGGATYFAKAGYVGYVPDVHVDMQEIRIYRTGPASEEVWLSNDGGIHHSTDLMETHQSRCRGIRAGNLWGFDQGWNDDVLVGGRYHNGNMGHYEGYPAGEFLAIGGAESATGYANYSNERKVYHSDIGGRILPTALAGTPQSFGVSLWPNESYFVNNSSRILFDHRYFNVAWMGRENKLYRSDNAGGSWTEVHAFGPSTGNQVLWIEQSYADPQVFVVHQELGNTSRLWRSADGGASWAQLTLPQNQRELYFTLSGDDPLTLWIGYTNGSNGNKVYRSTDGGATWTNLTTSTLDGRRIWGMAAQFGTDGGLYLALLNGSVYYRNNAMLDWAPWGDGLPVSTEPLRIVPFYKGGVVRLATWNLAVWERPLFEPSALIADFAAAFGSFYCPGDSVRFVDHSVAGPVATYAWSFPGATPATSADKYPVVVYAAPGTYDVTLTVTENGVSDTRTRTAVVGSVGGTTAPVVEGFESGAFRPDWTFRSEAGTTSAWAITDQAGGFGGSARSMWFNNYDVDLGGASEEVWTGKLDLTGAQGTYVAFDVAYSRYGGQYSDTLGVLASTDCGVTWDLLYLEGGDDLATAPSLQDPFVPTADQWRRDSVSLAAYDGQPELIVAFQDRGHWGNNLYVDNINLSAQLFAGVDDHASGTFTVFPNPTQDAVWLQPAGAWPGSVRVQVIDPSGRGIRDERRTFTDGRAERFDLSGVAAGRYAVVLTGLSGRLVRPLVVR